MSSFPKLLTSTVRKPHFLDVHCKVHCTSTGRPLSIHSTPHTRPEGPVFFLLAHAPLGGAHTWLPRGGPSHSPRRGGEPGNAPRPNYEPTDSRPPSRGGGREYLAVQEKPGACYMSALSACTSAYMRRACSALHDQPFCSTETQSAPSHPYFPNRCSCLHDVCCRLQW